MRGTLTKVFSTHNNLRTSSVTGDFEYLPVVGRGFDMIADALEIKGDGAFRYVGTSPVEQIWPVEVGEHRVLMFKTENSVYGLTVAPE